MPFGAVVCNDRVHGGFNWKVEDMESRDGEEMPAGENEEDNDHGPWSKSGPSDLKNVIQILRPSVKMFFYYVCIGHLGQYVSLLLCGVKTKQNTTKEC